MDEYEQELKIPKERIAVVIGTNGKTKSKIEKETNTKVDISKEGLVEIVSDNSLDSWIARQIVKAIGRGFSPEHAFMLLDESSSFELIEMKDWAKNESQMKRLKGRVIGEDGKSKRTIEQLTDTHISVYGKTIGILGDSADVQTSRKAIEMLLSGARHATVYNLLENEQKKKKKLEFMDGEE